MIQQQTLKLAEEKECDIRIAPFFQSLETNERAVSSDWKLECDRDVNLSVGAGRTFDSNATALAGIVWVNIPPNTQLAAQ